MSRVDLPDGYCNNNAVFKPRRERVRPGAGKRHVVKRLIGDRRLAMGAKDCGNACVRVVPVPVPGGIGGDDDDDDEEEVVVVGASGVKCRFVSWVSTLAGWLAGNLYRSYRNHPSSCTVHAHLPWMIGRRTRSTAG